MTSPSAGRGQPPLEHIAADVLAVARGQQRRPLVPERRPLSAEDQRLADEAAANDARICRYCIGVHKFPTSVGCPRLASGELSGDGTLKSFTFWPGTDWAEGRVTFIEDLHEKGDADDQ